NWRNHTSRCGPQAWRPSCRRWRGCRKSARPQSQRSSLVCQGARRAMTTRGKIADAEGDIAALVYLRDDRPDLVLCDFARQLANRGRGVCGLVQLRDRASEESPSRVMVLDSWQVVDVVPAGGCRLDAQWLDQMGARIKTLIARGVDAVIVNRFGPLEA